VKLKIHLIVLHTTGPILLLPLAPDADRFFFKELLHSVVDVIITIFCDFPQFLARKIGVFLKYQCYDQLFQNLALF
jgi:hypothetical protein